MRRLWLVSLAGVLLSALALSPAAAAPAGGVVSGACTETDLNNALAGGGTVTFSCGGPKTISLSSVKTITQGTTIDGGGVITLTGNSDTQLFSVNLGTALTLRRIVLYRGYSDTSDGGAVVNHGTLTLADTVISNSGTDVDHNGGAIFSDGALNVSGSTFTEMNSGSGGAIYLNSAGGKAQISASSFGSNQAFNALTGYGGAIWVGPGAQLDLHNSYLAANMAPRGGALYISPGGVANITANPLTLSFFDNSASKTGGAINNQAGGQLNTSGVYLYNNHTVTGTPGIGGGGAIYSAGALSLHDTYFVNNTARLGGGLRLDGPSSGTLSVVLDRNAFVNNFAQVSGGGMYLEGAGSQVLLTHSLVDENTAKTGAGGGIARINNGLTVIDSSIIANGAGSSGGGGLWATTSPGPSSTGGAVQVLDSTINQNTVPGGSHGGGIQNGAAQVNLRNVTIVENVNGIYNAGSGVVMTTTNSVFWNDGSLNCDGGAPGLIHSQGGNFSSDLSCAFAGSHDTTAVGVDPVQGRTITFLNPVQAIVFYLPKPGGDLVNSALPVCSVHDERDAVRPDACDKGAVELGGLLPRIFAPLAER
jgi:predicted outer membrane repeat protein